MLYMVTLTMNVPQMLAYIPYMDPLGMLFMVMLGMVYGGGIGYQPYQLVTENVGDPRVAQGHADL